MTAVATATTVVLAGVALAGTSVDTTDVGIVGDAATSPSGATLVRGGTPATFNLTVTANDGAFPDSQCSQAYATASNTYTVGATDLGGSAATTQQFFTCPWNMHDNGAESVTFNGLNLAASATSGDLAPLGRSNYSLTFGSGGLVALGTQVNLSSTFSAPTVYVTVNPRPASNLQLHVNGAHQIDLSWTGSPDAGDITDYVIERDGSDLSTHPANTDTTASDTGLTAGTQYCYRIRARYNDGTNDFYSSYAPATAVCATTASAGYTTSGFLNPVDTVNAVKAGQTIPLKWVLDNGSGVVTDTTIGSGAYSLSSAQISCTLLGTNDDPPVAGDAGNSGLRFDTLAGQSIYNWQTVKSWAQTCRRFTVTYAGFSVASAQFQFTK